MSQPAPSPNINIQKKNPQKSVYNLEQKKKIERIMVMNPECPSQF